MSYIKKAGLVLYSISGNNLYFRCMIPSDSRYGGSSPQIPKGTIDEGDTPQYTAIKECMEETGLTIENMRSIRHFKVYKRMKMSVFIGTVLDDDAFDEPHWESKWSGWVKYDPENNILRDIQQHIFDDIHTFLVSEGAV